MSMLKVHLATSGIIAEADLVRAEELAASEKISLVRAIEKLNLAPSDKLLEALGRFYRVPVAADMGEMDIPRQIIDLIPRALATKHRVIPIDRIGNNIIVAMGDPRNLDALNEIRFSVGFFPKPVLASELKIDDALARYYAKGFEVSPKDAADVTGANRPNRAERQDIGEGESGDGPVIKLVNQILLACLQRRASDIHIEPYETFLRVRLRIDGVLHEIARPPMSMRAALTSRIKIMSSLNIAETRLPQDGAINISIGNRPIDFRVSTVPIGASGSEKIVMRILDKSALQTDMTKLGFEPDELEKFMKSIHNPFGMVLVTGPTGSGKTTTLYSALAELNQVTDNIMTAEDPIEYNLEGINQVGMKPDIKLNFAAALKAFLRQDPDVIMVGEIRDQETGEIAIKAALTGHMVLSTLHTNSAPETISRLLNMKLASFDLVSALTCVTAQRLVRKICEHCRVVDEEVTAKIMVELGIHPQYADRVKAYKGAGCRACNNTGNKGRIAVHEVLALSDPVREAILDGVPALRLKRIAMANGMRSLRQSALNKMVQGITSAQEVIKSTASDGNVNESRGDKAS